METKGLHEEIELNCFNCVQQHETSFFYNEVKIDISYCLSLNMIAILVIVWVFFRIKSCLSLCWIDWDLPFLMSRISVKIARFILLFKQTCVIYFHKSPSAFFIKNGDQKETENGIIDVNILRKLTTLVQLIPFLHPIGKYCGRLKPEFFAMYGSIPRWRGICSVLILISTILGSCIFNACKER